MSKYKSINYGKTDTIFSRGNKKVGHRSPLLINPQQYFQDFETALTTENNEDIINELEDFFSLTKKKDFTYYPSFSSSNLPSIFMNLLTSEEESDYCYLSIILKIITNLSSEDYQYCASFSTQGDIINILFDLFYSNISINATSDIALYSINSIFNFVAKSIEYRDDALNYLLPTIKFAQRKEESQIKNYIFRFIFNLTLYEVDTDQLQQILRAICNLIDFVDDSTSLILTLSLRKLSDYYDIYPYLLKTPILNFFSRNLSSTQDNLIYVTLLVFSSILKNNSFQEIPDLPKIIKFINSLNADLVKSACLVLSNIVENSSDAFSEEDAHYIIQIMTKEFDKRKVEIKKYIIEFLILLFGNNYSLIKEVDFEDFIASLVDFLYIDDAFMLIPTLKLIDIILTDEFDSDGENPLINYLSNDEKIELIKQLTDHENRSVADSATQILNSLDFVQKV